MRVETAGARTWLLAVVALWAVCVWLLAAFGLGGRMQALPEDPALLQPLPQAGALAGETPGPLPQYAAIRERPLFSPDRQHRPFFIDPDGDDDERMDGFDVVLTSVLITPGLEMAIVQSTRDEEAIRFRVGESAPRAPDWTLVSVAPRSAVFAGPEGERTLQLRTFDGAGGEPPPSAGTDLVAEEEPPATDDDGDAQAAQAEAIRARIEARRARVREQREQQSQAPTQARENP